MQKILCQLKEAVRVWF